MAFVFTYQKLLEQRKRQEDEAHRDFQIEISNLMKEEKILLDLVAKLAKARDAIAVREAQGGSSIEMISQADGFIEGQKIRIHLQRRKIEEQKRLVEQKREILQGAAREYKIIDKLKQNHQEAYRKEMLRREMKTQDDIATMRFKRKSVL